jgi:MATE family multidrug resistance protein
MCYYLGITEKMGPLGVWIGLTIGLVLASIALYWRFQHKVRRID